MPDIVSEISDYGYPTTEENVRRRLSKYVNMDLMRVVQCVRRAHSRSGKVFFLRAFGVAIDDRLVFVVRANRAGALILREPSQSEGWAFVVPEEPLPAGA